MWISKILGHCARTMLTPLVYKLCSNSEEKWHKYLKLIFFLEVIGGGHGVGSCSVVGHVPGTYKASGSFPTATLPPPPSKEVIETKLAKMHKKNRLGQDQFQVVFIHSVYASHCARAWDHENGPRMVLLPLTLRKQFLWRSWMLILFFILASLLNSAS